MIRDLAARFGRAVTRRLGRLWAIELTNLTCDPIDIDTNQENLT